MKKSVILFIAVSVLVIYLLACSSMTPIPPEFREIESSYVINASYDEAWDAVVGYFAKKVYTIEVVEKESGIIVSDNLLLKQGLISADYLGNQIMNLGYCNCGTHGLYYFRNLYVKFNVFVKEVDESSTFIQVNARFYTTYFDNINNTSGLWECATTGELEKTVMRGILEDSGFSEGTPQ